MEEPIQDFGLKITKKEQEDKLGLMGGCMKVNSLMMLKKAMDIIVGVMDANSKDGGIKTNNMELAYIKGATKGKMIRKMKKPQIPL